MIQRMQVWVDHYPDLSQGCLGSAGRPGHYSFVGPFTIYSFVICRIKASSTNRRSNSSEKIQKRHCRFPLCYWSQTSDISLKLVANFGKNSSDNNYCEN